MLYVSLVFANSPVAFTFASTAEDLEVGDLVAAPLRGKVENGIVIAISEKKPDFAVKPLGEIVRKSVLTGEQSAVAEFIREYYAAHAGKVWRLFVPARVWQNRPAKRQTKTAEIKKVPQPKKKLTADQKKVFEKILASKSNILYARFLRGLFDTDGCLYIEKGYPKLEFGFASKPLRDTLADLLKSLNFRFSIWESRSQRNETLCISYKLRIGGKESLFRWFKEVSPGNPKHLNKYERYLPTMPRSHNLVLRRL